MIYDQAENPREQVILPPTEKQILFAKRLAMQTGTPLPWDVQQGRHSLSRWIDDRRAALQQSDVYLRPSSKQVAFAERIARIRRTNVPEECFHDRKSMSRWIDYNKH